MMPQEKRSLLDKNLILFNQMDVEAVIESLISKEVLNETVAESIISNQNERGKKKELIKAIQRRGEAAFDALYDALCECGHVEIAAILEPFVNHATSKHQFVEPTIPTSPRYRRRTISPSRAAPVVRAHRESISSTYQDVITRDRSRSRPSRALHNSDWLNYSPQSVSLSRASIPNFGGSIGYARSPIRQKIQNVPYIFNEESMNYVDSPHIERVFDKETMYPNFSNPRGLCLIINNEHFEQMPSRNGTRTDKENLSNLFRSMGYHIIERDNLTSSEILITVSDFTKDRSHRMASSAIIVILSHGEENQIIGVDDRAVGTNEVLDLLAATRAPFLANKPKLVFVQACRGERRDTGFPFRDEMDGAPMFMRRHNYDRGDGPMFNFFSCVKPQNQPIYRKKPDQADILVAYATTAQYVSWRNSLRGSWFIQAICEVFAKHSTTMDVVEMLTEVNKRVACGFQTSQGSTTLKQMPELTSRLVKKFYFWPVRNSPV